MSAARIQTHPFGAKIRCQHFSTPSSTACQHAQPFGLRLSAVQQRLHTWKAEVLRCEAELPVIFLVAVYLCGAVELFEEDDSGEGVRECDAAEGPEVVGSLQNIRGEAERAADYKGDVTPA